MYDINKLIESGKKTLEQANSKFKNDNKIKIAFLPEGMHTVKIIPDEDLKFYSEVVVHKPNSKYIKCLKHDYSSPDSECPICEAISKANDAGVPLAYNNNRQVLRKMYMYLVNTNNKSQYWTPGELYCVCPNKKVIDAFNNLLTYIDSIEDPEIKKDAYDIFNPSKKTKTLSLIFTKGAQGNCTIQKNDFVEIDPLDLSPYVPEGKDMLPDLDTVYVNSKVNPSIEEVAEEAKTIHQYILNTVGTVPPTSQVTSQPQVVQQTQQSVPQGTQSQPNIVNQQPTTINTANIDLPPAPQTTNDAPWN